VTRIQTPHLDSEHELEEEELERHKLDRKIVNEEHWMRYGVTARRKRNMRRVGELADLRRERRDALGDGGGGWSERCSATRCKDRNSRIKLLQTFSPNGARSACDVGHSMAGGLALFLYTIFMSRRLSCRKEAA